MKITVPCYSRGAVSETREPAPSSPTPRRATPRYGLSDELKSRRQEASQARDDAPELNPDALRTGDVLMYKIGRHTPSQISNAGHACLTLAQLHLMRRQPDTHHLGSLALTHAATVVQPSTNGQPPQVVEAMFPSQGVHDIAAGEHLVYRLTDPLVAETSGKIAKTWAGEPARYPFEKVAAASKQIVRHGASLDDQAMRGIETMARQHDQRNPDFMSRGAFCSELATAAIQAAAVVEANAADNEGQVNPIIHTPAHLTTPITMVHQMTASDQVELIGKVIIPKA